jgi:nicotinate dehydrogenase subunit A
MRRWAIVSWLVLLASLTMMMTAAWLLNQDSQPDEATVAEALNANLCRCGTHVRIVRAVQRAAGTLS